MNEVNLKTRHKLNPFLDNMIVPLKNKSVKLSRLGKEDNVLLMNESTGEVHGTHLTTYKKVDGERFIKLFTANVGLTFELTAAGIKAFSVLLHSVQESAINKGEVDLDSYTLEEFMEKNKDSKPPLKLSIATFKRGLNEMEKAQIVAKTVRQGRYFINPNFVFNGDRIAFTTLIERNKPEQKD